MDVHKTTIQTEPVTSLADMLKALNNLSLHMAAEGIDPETVYLKDVQGNHVGTVHLQEETLTDHSKVFNLILV